MPCSQGEGISLESYLKNLLVKIELWTNKLAEIPELFHLPERMEPLRVMKSPYSIGHKMVHNIP